MLQRWRAVGNTMSDLFEPQNSRSRDERVAARPTGENERPIIKIIRNKATHIVKYCKIITLEIIIKFTAV